jgi:hypothetical protein
VGTLGQKGAESAGEAAEGLRGLLRDLFEDEPER